MAEEKEETPQEKESLQEGGKEALPVHRVPREEEEKRVVSRIADLIVTTFTRLNPLKGRRTTTRIRPRFTVESLAGKIRGKEIDSYPVGQARVHISVSGNTGYYEVSEPALNEREKEIYRELLENFYDVLSPAAATARDPMKYVEGAIWKSADELGMLKEVRESYSKYKYFIERDGIGYGKLQVPMNDSMIEEITITSHGVPARVLHRKHNEYDWLTTNIVFHSEMELRSYAQKLAQQLGESLTAAAPISDATTRQGDRVSLTFGDEVTHPGSTLTIRKPTREPLSLAKLVENGTLSLQMAAYLWQVLAWGGFPQIIGDIGSGKSTLLNAILATVSPNKKMTTLEEALELNLPHENWHRFHTRLRRFGKGKEFEVDLQDLVKLVMRHRPDYLAVGEVRGEEIKALTHVASIGHSASCTFHAETPEKALTRMRSDPMNLAREELLLVWCFPLTARIWRVTGAVRRVTSIHELNRGSEGEPELTKVFSHDFRTDSFEPDDLQEVVKRSRRLREAGEIRGLGEEGVIRALEKKIDFLENLVEQGKLSFDEYTQGVREFYAREGG